MRRLWVAMAVVLVLVAAGCGGDDDDTSSGGGGGYGDRKSESESEGEGSASELSSKAGLSGDVTDKGSKTVKDGDTVEVEIDDMYFEPTFIGAPVGAKLTVELKNEGELQHTFTSEGLDIDEEVDPGDSAEVEVTLPDSGSAAFLCRFHKGSGMQGALVVVESPE